MGYRVDQIFVIRDNSDESRTEVGPDPDNEDFIKITEIGYRGEYRDSLTMHYERAVKVAEAILKLAERC